MNPGGSIIIFFMMEHLAVSKFREYLQIETVQPKPDYPKCSEFLKRYAKEIGLNYQEEEFVKGKPVIVISWIGSIPELPSIILNSHTDVVPVSEENWTHPPFSAFKSTNGNIYARGSQDMKCVGIWYMESIRNLMAAGKRLKRTLHLTFVPDEEIGGHDGMMKFRTSSLFKGLNAGYCLDEGLANKNNAFKVYYGERSPWWLKLKAKGGAGHGSQFIEPLSTARLIKVLTKFLAFRDAELQRLNTSTNSFGAPLTLGDVTSLNVTMLNAGVQMNVVPEHAEAGVDMRVTPTTNLHKLEQTILKWCQEENVELEFDQKFTGSNLTVLNKDNLVWMALQDVASEFGVALQPEIFPAATDSRFLREIGLPALGISAIKNTPVLLYLSFI
jgi:aminoacylase